MDVCSFLMFFRRALSVTPTAEIEAKHQIARLCHILCAREGALGVEGLRTETAEFRSNHGERDGKGAHATGKAIAIVRHSIWSAEDTVWHY